MRRIDVRWARRYFVMFVILTVGMATTVRAGAPDVAAMSFASDGSPALGAPDAPIVMEEWSDYACPFCGRHFRQTTPGLVEKYVRTGKVRLVFRDLPLAGLHPTAAQAHVAARCAGEQRAAAYWSMHNVLFEHQSEWTSLPDPTVYLAETFKKLGLDAEALRSCVSRGEQARRVAESAKAGEELGFSGTPSFRFIASDGRSHTVSGAYPSERFEGVIEAMLAGKPPSEEPKPPPPELPFWAKPEGLAPDPTRPGYTRAGDAFKGSPDAPVTVVEFIDFQCPPCAKHVLEVQPRIDADLVATGKVRWVAKHLPLKMHEYAPLAAAAAECAGEQGQFWRFHDRLFATADRWAVSDAEAQLVEIAADAGLDRRAFTTCVGGRHALARVLDDLYDAKDVVERTPSFVILKGGPAGAISGAKPADAFIKMLSPEADVPTPSSP